MGHFIFNIIIILFILRGQFDYHLIIEAAKAGKGSYSFISDDNSTLEHKVLKALREASKPWYTDININWNNLLSALKYSGKYNLNIDNVYEEEPISIFAIFNKEKLAKLLNENESNNIEISMINTFTQEKENLKISIDLKVFAIHYWN